LANGIEYRFLLHGSTTYHLLITEHDYFILEPKPIQ